MVRNKTVIKFFEGEIYNLTKPGQFYLKVINEFKITILKTLII